jgi:hypothetical protein
MRPFHETERHRAEERAMVERVAEAWSCRIQKLPLAYCVDWALGSPRTRQTRAWVEAKDRSTYDWDFYERHGGVFLSAMKWATTRGLSRATGVPFMFLVKARDGSLWYHRPDDWSHDGVQIDAGRTDRGDWQDVEPCILLRQARFARVEPMPVAPPAPVLLPSQTPEDLARLIWPQ